MEKKGKGGKQGSERGDRADGPRRSGPKGDGPRRSGPKGDGPRRSGPKGDGPRRSGPKGDGPRRSGPKGDGPRRSGPKGDGPRRSGPRGDAPRRPGPRDAERAPSKPKQVFQAVDRVLTPDRWIGRGEAVCEPDGAKPTLVWGGIPGEAGLAKVHHQGQHQYRARWLSAEEPDPRRREPPCDKYDRCGSCPLMHLEPEAQDDARLSIVADLFSQHGLRAPVPTEVIASPDGVENYRYVVKMACGRSDWGRPRLGAYERDSHKILPIPNCRVATSALRRAMGTVTHHILESGMPPYDAKEDKGVLRHVIIRESRLSGKMLVTLVCARRPRDAKDLADEIAQSLSTVAGVHLHINAYPGNNIFHVEDGRIGTVNLTGESTVEDEIAGMRMRFGPADFFQANPGTADLIVRDVLALSEDLADRPVVDLYSGVGTFSLPLAARHPWVGGVEFAVVAVERARENAARVKVPAEFFAGTVAERVQDLIPRVSSSAPVVVLDPARKGIEDEAFDPIERLRPARMLYVSCNPAALARDLAEWTKRGWTVDEVRAYDMFPQTAHLEMLAVLSPAVVPTPERGGPRRRLVR